MKSIWILQHVIVAKSSFEDQELDIFAFEKQGLKQSRVSGVSLEEDLLEYGDKCEEEIVHCSPSGGLRFLAFIWNNCWPLPDDKNVKFVVREVPFDYTGKECLRIHTFRDGYLHNAEDAKVTFSKDGCRFIYHEIQGDPSRLGPG